MSDIQIALSLLHDGWSSTVASAQTAEQSGLHSIALIDSPIVERDVHLASAACALNTTNLKVVTGATNPVTRHPSVTAAAYVQLEELAPGRIICGIATGDSAVWGVGLKAAKVAELREYILAVKAMLRGEIASWRGAEFRGRWRGWEPFDLPVYVACAGPRTVRMAAQVTDGLILSVGVAPEDLEWVQVQIEEACREVGRDPAALDVWHVTEVTFAENAEAASARTLGIFAHWLTLGGTKGKRVPEEYKPLLAELNADTKSIERSYRDPDRGRVLVERAKQLGVYDWLMSRSARLWGTPEEMRQRLGELRALGASNWMLAPDGMNLDNIEITRRVGELLK